MKADASSVLNLNTLKRPELQKLAKQHGIKANLRNAKLIEEISKVLSEFSSPSPKRKSNVSKKFLSPDLSNISSDIASLDSISPPPLQDLSFDKSDTETNVSRSKKNVKTGSRSSSRTRKEKNKKSEADHDILNVEAISNSVSRRKNARVSGAIATTRSRSSSRNRPATQTPGSAKQKKTPSNKTGLPKAVNTKTFSVPKNRTQGRLSSTKKKEVKAVKPAIKRKSSAIEQPSQAKRGRPSTRRSKEKIADHNAKKAIFNSATKKASTKSKVDSFSAKNIPSFAVKGLTVPKTSASTPSTKMFQKAHQKNFNKMESIDDYQKRKEERIEKLFGSNKKLERLARPKTPSIVKPVNRPKPNFCSPKPKSVPSAKKALNKQSGFKPSVTRVADINTNFGSKKSKLPTPKKVTVSFAKTTEKKASALHTPAQKNALTKRKSGTPFRQNTSVVNTPQSEKKPAFDLQESLKKPLSWKPHKGPLKKFDDTTKKPSLKERAKNMKQPKLTSREARRAQAKGARAAAKSDRMMMKRGLK